MFQIAGVKLGHSDAVGSGTGILRVSDVVKRGAASAKAIEAASGKHLIFINSLM